MKENIKNLWVAALRSGNYEQGKEALQDGNCYCCLGVLCMVAEKEGVELVRNSYVTSKGDLFGVEIGDQDRVEEWSDLTDTAHLISMNDDIGNNFNEIADYIEKEWESL